MTKKTFNKHLFAWYDENARRLPWVGQKDAYLVWLSEVILQQTRVEQGLKYYELFKKKFPTVTVLADADETTVLKLWEGLGYYSRARNLHATAQTIVKNHKGRFPSTYDEIRKLKGIGDYTAAAIASFAFNLPYAAVDANVQRILARIFGITDAIDSAETKKNLSRLAQKLLNEKDPARHNQAMMDFGATVCKPASPDCVNCPMKKHCYAFQNDVVGIIPVKGEKAKKRKRFFHYLVITQGKKIFIKKRTGKDTWKNMYEFPLVEAKKNLRWHELKKTKEVKNIFAAQEVSPELSNIFSQQLTHQTIYARFFMFSAPALKLPGNPAWLAVDKKRLKDFPFPGIIREHLQEVL